MKGSDHKKNYQNEITKGRFRKARPVKEVMWLTTGKQACLKVKSFMNFPNVISVETQRYWIAVPEKYKTEDDIVHCFQIRERKGNFVIVDH